MTENAVADAPTSAPAWFLRSIADDGTSGRVQVDGVPIAWRAWGEPGAPPLVLVHGGAAHARWWSAHAPLLATDHRVIAVDLSGHGDSGHRAEYHPAQWAREVLAVADAAGDSRTPVVVGHSMGGLVTVLAAARHGAALAGAVIVDTPVRLPDPESAPGTSRRMLRDPKVYPSLDEAMEHFHLVPPQPCDNTWIVEHTARHSLRRIEAGWTWKFDPRVFSNRRGPRSPGDFAEDLAGARCRMAVVYGARSDIVDAHVRETMADLLADAPAARAGVPFVEVPEARHHVLLDQPLALVTALRAVLAAWSPVGVAPPGVAGTPDQSLRR